MKGDRLLQFIVITLFTALFTLSGGVMHPFVHAKNTKDIAINRNQTIVRPGLELSRLTAPTLSSHFPDDWLAQGKLAYDAGRFQAAIQYWQQALSGFEQHNDSRHATIAWRYLAIAYQDLGEWAEAERVIALALHHLSLQDDPFLRAQILNTQGSLAFNLGHSEAALETWQQAATLYRSLKDETGLALNLINQAQAMQALGLYQRARTTLEQLTQTLTTQPDSLLKAQSLRSLGMTLQTVGDLNRSRDVLETSLVIAQSLQAPADVAATLFQLGNTARARNEILVAIAYYSQAIALAPPMRLQLEAQLNQLSLWVKTGQSKLAIAAIPSIQTSLAAEPPSRWAIYAQVNLAQTLMNLGQTPLGDIAATLAQVVQQAKALNDVQAESYALGQLGALYERTGQWSDALTVTQTALTLANRISASDIAVNWQWQLGRILKAQWQDDPSFHPLQAAIAAYDQAIQTLSSLRQDLVAMNPDVQFSFRDQVEPVYRQFVQLLLHDVDALPEGDRQQRLQQSRNAIEALQLAELQNFFREACQTYEPKAIEAIDPHAAVIYPIVLNQRLEVILSLPGQPLHHYSTTFSAGQAGAVVRALRQALNPAFLPDESLQPAQQLYDWLVRPAESALAQQPIDTLVFALDDFWRDVPMAVLHDGHHYLVEKYNLALTPGLKLFASSPSSRPLKLLVGGLTEARQGFLALPGVKREIEAIATQVPTQVLLDEDFTIHQFAQTLEQIPVSGVHFATHGQFSSNADDTFVLTWDGRIRVQDLAQWLSRQDDPRGDSAARTPIDLLVLSACQTAKGDNRATLGLAGVAVRSGARSTLATLWTVQDQSTADLMTAFYHALVQPHTTKAAALRQAQLSLLHHPNYRHPFYWAAFVLVGNWQ